MSNINEKPDLSFGFQRYSATVKDLEGILNKLEELFNIKENREKLETIKKETEVEISGLTQMPYEGMQLDYEGFTYDKFIKQLEALKDKLET